MTMFERSVLEPCERKHRFLSEALGAPFTVY